MVIISKALPHRVSMVSTGFPNGWCKLHPLRLAVAVCLKSHTIRVAGWFRPRRETGGRCDAGDRPEIGWFSTKGLVWQLPGNACYHKNSQKNTIAHEINQNHPRVLEVMIPQVWITVSRWSSLPWGNTSKFGVEAAKIVCFGTTRFVHVTSFQQCIYNCTSTLTCYNAKLHNTHRMHDNTTVTYQRYRHIWVLCVIIGCKIWMMPYSTHPGPYCKKNIEDTLWQTNLEVENPPSKTGAFYLPG